MNIRAIVLSWAAAVVLGGNAMAADAARGGQLAQRWCVSCHVIASAQRGPVSEATPFPAIARRPGFSEHALAFFLLDPHPRMPDMSLTRSEATDLAAYIATLK
jgi:mono/diheme cytochrome c family protein